MSIEATPSAEEGPVPGPSSIPLYLINGVATVWDAQVAATLHCTHNISGLRAGTLPGVAQQNAFLGLPLTLMREETAYLVRTGIAHLVPLRPEAQFDRASVDVQTQARLRKLREQARRAKEDKEKKEREAQARHLGGEAAREKREARARLRAAKEAARRQAAGGEELFGENRDTPTPPQEVPPANDAPVTGPPADADEQLDISQHFHLVPSHPSSSDAYGPPITTIPHPLFPFPRTDRDRALLDTFTELQRRELRMGLGPRFGGEYLIYPGDYLRYHAHFTSQVIVRDEPIRPAEIVAWGRLGTGTKKAGLLCCWEADEKSSQTTDADPAGEEAAGVEFYSLEWANFG